MTYQNLLTDFHMSFRLLNCMYMVLTWNDYLSSRKQMVKVGGDIVHGENCSKEIAIQCFSLRSILFFRRHRYGKLSARYHSLKSHFNPFFPNALFLYPLKTSENRKIFWCFQGVVNGCIGKKWVNSGNSYQ